MKKKASRLLAALGSAWGQKWDIVKLSQNFRGERGSVYIAIERVFGSLITVITHTIITQLKGLYCDTILLLSDFHTSRYNV